jgi:protein-tyrosine kinase
MAKFRDSGATEAQLSTVEVGAGSGGQRQAPPPAAAQGESAVIDRSIGDILAELRNLTVEQVEQVLAYQRDKGVRFGEAAVALGMASKEDVLFALSQQFHYPYAPEERRAISPELVALNEPFSARAESFRALRSQLMMRLFADGEPRRAVAIISPQSGDGKTYCAANLAVTLAQLGGRTLLVDADMRGPRQHEVFKLENRAGLSGILSGRSDSHVIQQVVGVPSLFVLPVGTTPPNPLELVERPAFGLLMRELANKFDHVIVDTPAAMNGSDASVIAARCGAALLVARKDESRVAMLQELAASFAGSAVKLAGVVVNEF